MGLATFIHIYIFEFLIINLLFDKQHSSMWLVGTFKLLNVMLLILKIKSEFNNCDKNNYNKNITCLQSLENQFINIDLSLSGQKSYVNLFRFNITSGTPSTLSETYRYVKRFTPWLNFTGCRYLTNQGLRNLSSDSLTDCVEFCSSGEFYLGQEQCICRPETTDVNVTFGDDCYGAPCVQNPEGICGEKRPVDRNRLVCVSMK